MVYPEMMVSVVDRRSQALTNCIYCHRFWSVTFDWTFNVRELTFITTAGAMGSYVAFYLSGLYPVPGTRQFLLSSPFFPEISFFNPIFGKTTTIKSENFKGNPADGTEGTVFVKVNIDYRSFVNFRVVESRIR